jgi:hypothetical protein
VSTLTLHVPAIAFTAFTKSGSEVKDLNVMPATAALEGAEEFMTETTRLRASRTHIAAMMTILDIFVSAKIRFESALAAQSEASAWRAARQPSHGIPLGWGMLIGWPPHNSLTINCSRAESRGDDRLHIRSRPVDIRAARGTIRGVEGESGRQ